MDKHPWEFKGLGQAPFRKLASQYRGAHGLLCDCCGRERKMLFLVVGREEREAFKVCYKGALRDLPRPSVIVDEMEKDIAQFRRERREARRQRLLAEDSNHRGWPRKPSPLGGGT